MGVYLFVMELHVHTYAVRADVEDVRYVVNFDFPAQTEDYIHRIGRTARAARKGTAYTFFTTNNCKQAKELIDILKEANQMIEPKLYEMIQMAKGIARFKQSGVLVCVCVCVCVCCHDTCDISCIAIFLQTIQYTNLSVLHALVGCPEEAAMLVGAVTFSTTL